MGAPVTLEHPEGRVFVEDLGSGRKRVAVELVDPSVFMPTASVETNYSLELIEAILVLRGPAMLGYSIRRAEEPAQLAEPLRHYILSFVSEAEFEGERLLDFGCGSGSSTVALARLFPRTEILAVDLEEDNVAVARLRAAHYEVANATFLVSPGPLELPRDIGAFDFACLSAVYEHLLPAERPVLMMRLWRVLRPGGILFLNQTPHRYYPLEYHTTGLPLLNYLPARAAFFAARHLSRRVDRGQTWEELLRGGVRGATEGEILGQLRATGDGIPMLLRPSRLGLEDQVDLWYSLSMAQRPRRLKRAMRPAFKGLSRVTASSFVPSLALAIRKA
jgi:2-polyprenyl-3-methyl-5-hydroxy-6-metoxy-1,4-benzoquinol methylase